MVAGCKHLLVKNLFPKITVIKCRINFALFSCQFFTRVNMKPGKKEKLDSQKWTELQNNHNNYSSYPYTKKKNYKTVPEHRLRGLDIDSILNTYTGFRHLKQSQLQATLPTSATVKPTMLHRHQLQEKLYVIAILPLGYS